MMWYSFQQDDWVETTECMQHESKSSCYQNPDKPSKSRSQIPNLRDVIPSFKAANFDPFETCPAIVGPFEHALIHHCEYYQLLDNYADSLSCRDKCLWNHDVWQTTLFD
jgi:hypothetical protein